MASRPTSRDLAALRRLRKKAGSDAALRAWVEIAMARPGRHRRKGATTYDDAEMFQHLALFCEVARREKGMKPFTAIKWLVEAAWRANPKRLGPSVDAVARRLYGKIKRGELPRTVLPSATFKPLV